jgi:hypothetical protein
MYVDMMIFERSVTMKRYVVMASIVIVILLQTSSLHGYSLRLVKTYSGKEYLSTLGHDAASLDFDGDGMNDLLLSALNESNHKGRTYIMCGSSILPDQPCFFMSGEEVNDFFGYSIDNAGDVNDDEWDDFIVGAYQQGISEDPSKAYIYYGGSLADSEPDVIFRGSAIRDYFGYAVAGAGDLNDDGYDDVMVGADDAESGLGRVYFYFGGNPPDTIADLIVTGFVPHGHLGASAAGLGDVNDDGFDDVLVGAHAINAGNRSYGYAEVFFGGGELDENYDLLLVGESTYSLFGWSAAGLGDINSDGYNDIAVGAKTDNAGGYQAGRVYVFFGGSPPDSIPDIVFTGENEGDLFGSDVQMIGDVNLDGYNDIAIGAIGAGTGEQGKVYIYFGSPDGPDNIADIVLKGENLEDEFGNAVARTSDINHNGLPDISISARKNDGGYFNAGKVYIYELPPIGVGIGLPVPGVFPGDTLSFTANIVGHVGFTVTVLLDALLRPDSVTTISTEVETLQVSPFAVVDHDLRIHIPAGIDPGDALLKVNLADNMGNDLDHSITIVEIKEQVGIERDDPGPLDLPKETWLYQNSPNPFNPSTVISFSIEKERQVHLTIYDLRGHVVRTLLKEQLPAGFHKLVWNGADDNGAPEPSGVYFCRIIVAGKVMTRKMLLAK